MTYTLIVWLVITLPDGDKTAEAVFEDPREMTFTECRHRRQNELTFYTMLRNQDVRVLCIPEE